MAVSPEKQSARRNRDWRVWGTSRKWPQWGRHGRSQSFDCLVQTSGLQNCETIKLGSFESPLYRTMSGPPSAAITEMIILELLTWARLGHLRLPRRKDRRVFCSRPLPRCTLTEVLLLFSLRSLLKRMSTVPSNSRAVQKGEQLSSWWLWSIIYRALLKFDWSKFWKLSNFE